MKIFKNSLLKKLVYATLFILFFALIFKDPFSQRTLIPNFEPYPDTIYYLNPPISFLQGNGFVVYREGRSLDLVVSPLYPIVNIPAFILSLDPRMFYFTNVILSLISLLLFLKIITKLINNIWIIGFSLFLYVTNYFIFWMPTVAMAENLILPIFLIGVYLLITRMTKLNLLLATVVGICFYETKYAAAPLSVSFLSSYFIKSFIDYKLGKPSFKLLGFFALGIILIFFFTVSDNLFSYLSSLSGSSWFSLIYINKNLPLYLNALIGRSVPFLWNVTPIIPAFVGIGGLLGLFWCLFIKEFRLIGYSLLAMLFSSIVFLSTFYSADARYIYPAIPTLIVGFALFSSLLLKILRKRNLTKVFIFLFALLIIFHLITNLLRLKNQIMLNLKHAETPWYYLSVLKMNEYFTIDKIDQDKKPVVISAMIPYYIDFFSNGNYSLLPLSTQQEFRGAMDQSWGQQDYSDLTKLYLQYIQSGYPLFVGRYGLGNEGYLNEAFNKLRENFELTLVQEGCFSQCNIYKLEFKDLVKKKI